MCVCMACVCAGSHLGVSLVNILLYVHSLLVYIRNTHVGLVEDSHMTWATPEREGNTNTVILESSAGTIPPPTDTASWCGIQYMTKRYFTRLWHP
jgi:hypothetical protein